MGDCRRVPPGRLAGNFLHSLARLGLGEARSGAVWAILARRLWGDLQEISCTAPARLGLGEARSGAAWAILARRLWGDFQEIS